ncbi:hypothetical protein GGI21_003594, partial [Coemansia aciculifera]
HKQLSGLLFSQLVASPGDEGRRACKELILALINSQLKQHASIDSISDVLSKRCSSIFSASDVALYKALEYLKLAAEAEEGAETAVLAQEALALLVSVAATLSSAQVRGICDQFEALGQVSAVAALALACAAESDPGNEALAFWDEGAPANDPRREDIYRKRMDCYVCIIEMLDRRRHRNNVLGDIQALSSSSSSSSGSDALFQFALYDWLLATDQSALLFQMRAPYVERYLTLEPRTLEKCEMLWHFYIYENRFARASVVQRELACSPLEGIDLSRRIEYLSLSISNAKIAIDRVGRNDSATASRVGAEEEAEINGLAGLLRENEDQLEVAQVQLEVQQQLRAMGGHEEPAGALDRRLYSVTELFERYAEPLGLWDAMLLIFKASNHHDDDGDGPQLVADIWRTILRTVLDDEQRTGLMAVASKVARLGGRLHPSSAAFPLPVVAEILMELAGERPEEYAPGYVADTLVHAHVSHRAVFDVLNSMYVRQDGGGGGRTEFLVREIAALICSWIESAHSDGAGDGSRGVEESMPLVAVDQALSQYITNATLNNRLELKNELQRVQGQIRRIF